MGDQSTVAIFGATGALFGGSIVDGLLQQTVRQHFRNIIVFSRHKDKLRVLQHRNGLTLRTYTVNNLEESLTDVDIVVNAVGAVDLLFHSSLIRAIARVGGIKAYFPSEFGIDHNILDFKYEPWERKKQLVNLARDNLKTTKVCQVFVGFILETVLSPHLGMIYKKGDDVRFISVGSKDTLFSCTSVGDVGRSIAQLALLKPALLPEQVHVAGSTNSMAQIAAIMGRERGQLIRVMELSLMDYKASVLVSNPTNEAEYLRFIIGEGKANYGRGGLWNNNELVNPGQTRWRWKTMEDRARETGGKPWASDG